MQGHKEKVVELEPRPSKVDSRSSIHVVAHPSLDADVCPLPALMRLQCKATQSSAFDSEDEAWLR